MSRSLGLRRVLLVFVAGVLLIEGLYLIAAHAVLRTELGSRLVNRRPEKIRIDFGRSYSPWPGHVVVRDLAIVSQNRRNQWWLSVPRGSVRVSLTRLGWKEFQGHGIRADGVAFRLRRQRFAGEEPDGATGELLPPIPGLRLPTTESRADLAPPPSPRRVWTIDLRIAEPVTAREVWIENLRLDDGLRLDGRARFRLRKELLDLGPLRLEVEDGTIRSGEEVLARDLRLDLDGRLGPLAPVAPAETPVLRALSARLGVEGQVTSLGFLDPYLARAPSLAVGGSGRLVADLRADDGVLQPGSHLELDEEEVRVDFLGHTASGSGSIAVEVTEGPEKRTELVAVARRFSVAAGGAEVALLQGPVDSGRESGEEGGEGSDPAVLSLRVTGAPVDLARPSRDVALELLLPPSRFEILQAGRYLPRLAGFRAEAAGRGVVSGAFRYDTADRRGDGRLDASANDLRVVYGDLPVVGDVRLELRVDATDLEEGWASLTGSRVRLDRLRTGSDDGARDWRGAFRVPDGCLEVAAGRAEFVGDVEVEMVDTRPLVELMMQRKRWLHWIDGLLTVKNTSGEGRVALRRQDVLIDDLVVLGDHTEVRASLEVGSPPPVGLLFLRYRNLSAALEATPEGRDWKLVRSRRWYEAQRAGRPRIEWQGACPRRAAGGAPGLSASR